MTRRAARLLALALVPTVPLLATVDAPASGQATPSTFEATASADGMRALLNVPGAPLSQNVSDGGAPVTQAVVNGVGESVGFAAMPYPGETASSLPSLLLPLLGLPAPPASPLVARSQAGTTPEASASAGAVELAAKSDERSSEATSVSGGGSGGTGVGLVTTKTVARLDEAGAVIGEANVSIESFAVAGTLRIGALVATAKATHAPGSEPAFESTFSAEGVTSAGVNIGVSKDGLVLPGQTAPVPDTSGLSPALDAVGVSVRYLPAEDVEGGVVSAGLEVEVPVAVPGRDAATVTYVLGRARATVASSGDAVAVVDELDDLGDFESSTPVAGGSASVGGGSDLGATSSPVALGSGTATPTLSTPGPAAAIDGGNGATTAGGSVTGAQPAAATVPPSLSAMGFYLVLVVGAAVALTGGVLVRLIGVRLAWTS